MYSNLVSCSVSKRILLAFYILFLSLSTHAQIVVPVSGCSPVELFDVSNPWTFGGTNGTWLWDNPDKLQVTDDITGGGKAIILGGNTLTSTYNQNENSWAISPVYDLSAANSPYLEFSFYWSNEGSTNFDEIWMQFSIDNGLTWTDLAAPIGTGTCYDQNWYNYPDNWGGNTGGCFSGIGGPSSWVLVRKCISDLGNLPSVMFRFRLSTGTNCQNYGATIDNFSICDATIIANASYECTPQPLEIEFTDLSEDCPTNWFWDFGDSLTSTAQHPIHSYTQPGVYNVSLISATSSLVTSGCGGPYSDTFTFTVEVLDIFVDSIIDVSCYGTIDGAAIIGLIGANANPNFDWQPLPGNGQGTNSVTNLTEGNYAVTITPSNPTCVSTLNLFIDQPDSISIQAISNDASCPNICDGAISAVISGGTGGYVDILWMPGNIQGQNVNMVCDGTYSVQVEDASGCIKTVTNIITVGAGLAPILNTIPDYDFCNGNVVNIPNFTGNSVTSSTNWSAISGPDIGFGLSGSNAIGGFVATGLLDITTSINIMVQPLPNNGCLGISDTFTVNIHPIPDIDFEVNIAGGCEPLTVIFNNTSGLINSGFTWQFGDGDASDINTGVSHNYQAGNYTVSLSQTTPQNCTNTIIKSNYITVDPTPKTNFSYNPDVLSEDHLVIDFTNLTINNAGVSYLWDFGDIIGSSDAINPSYEYQTPESGFYKITLLAISDNGCQHEISKILIYSEPLVFYVPNAFTPDGNSINNEFKPIITSGVDIYDYHFVVWNRWGEIMFESFDPNTGWDGCYYGNCNLKSDVYVWKINYGLLDSDKTHTNDGIVNLIK